MDWEDLPLIAMGRQATVWIARRPPTRCASVTVVGKVAVTTGTEEAVATLTNDRPVVRVGFTSTRAATGAAVLWIDG